MLEGRIMVIVVILPREFKNEDWNEIINQFKKGTMVISLYCR